MSTKDNKVTLSEVKEKRKNNFRAKAGLSDNPHDEKTIRKDPSMEYIKSPKVHTFTELKQKRINDKCIDYKFKFNKKQEYDDIWTFDGKLLDSAKNLPPKRIKALSPEPIPKSYTKKKLKTSLVDKINDVVVFPGYKDKKEYFPSPTKPDIKYKWSTIEDKFR